MTLWRSEMTLVPSKNNSLVLSLISAVLLKKIKLIGYVTGVSGCWVECQDEGVISVQTALYGRADAVTCSEGRPPAQLANTHCSQAGTVDVVKKRCDGKRECELNTNIFTTDPCKRTYKYLNTTYCTPASQQLKDRLSLCMVRTMDVVTRPPAVTNGLPIKFKISPAQDQHAKLLTAVMGKTSVPSQRATLFGNPCAGTYKYLEVAYTCYWDNKYLKCSFGHSIWNG
ncbi:L-rhamnose-binding lectin CSL2-like [Perca flavescens]|uniref:L-rhamnose-binding lectin CSL2-like n=1 Tax=Perca flavescens TaxID=8167 RepID=UPI00106E61BD|nr:L-rhamnose-binding lectin CSL2-like [Perca flavescens]